MNTSVTPLTSVAALARQLESEGPAVAAVTLDLLGEVYEVRSDHAGLVEELRGYFAPFVVEDPSRAPDVRLQAYQRPPLALPPDRLVTPPLERGKKRLKEQYIDLPDGRVVFKVRTGMTLAFGGPLNVAVGPCTDNPNQVVNFVNNRLMSRELDRGAVLAHAAAVTLGDRTLAFAGFSGMGKSTTALHLMRETEAVFVSNDRLLMRRDDAGVCVAGVPKHPRINPGTALADPALDGLVPPDEAARLRALPLEELWSLEDKYDAIIDRHYGPGRFRLDGRLHAFVVLNWAPPGAAVRPSLGTIDDKGHLLEAIMKGPGLFHAPGAPCRGAT